MVRWKDFRDALKKIEDAIPELRASVLAPTTEDSAPLTPREELNLHACLAAAKTRIAFLNKQAANIYTENESLNNQLTAAQLELAGKRLKVAALKREVEAVRGDVSKMRKKARGESGPLYDKLTSIDNLIYDLRNNQEALRDRVSRLEQ